MPIFQSKISGANFDPSIFEFDTINNWWTIKDGAIALTKLSSSAKPIRMKRVVRDNHTYTVTSSPLTENTLVSYTINRADANFGLIIKFNGVKVDSNAGYPRLSIYVNGTEVYSEFPMYSSSGKDSADMIFVDTSGITTDPFEVKFTNANGDMDYSHTIELTWIEIIGIYIP